MASKLKLKVTPSRIKRNGVRLTEVHVIRKNMTFTQAKNIAQRISNHFSTKYKGWVYTNLKYKPSWMCSRDGATRLGEEVSLWTYDDYDGDKRVKFQQDRFDELYFYIERDPTRRGGCKFPNGLNDCLYYCLRTICNGQDRMPERIRTPESLKAFLKLPRSSKVDMSHIRLIERLLRVNINISGDHTSISPGKYKRTFEIRLINGHYSLPPNDEVKFKQLLRGYDFKEMKVVVFYIEDKTALLFFENTLITTDLNSYFQFRERNKKIAIFVRSEDSNVIKAYHNYIRDAETLKVVTNGEINLYKSPSMSCHAKQLFWKRSHGIEQPDDIDQLEASLLRIRAPLIAAKPGTYTNVYDYDINSMHMSIMAKNRFPMKRGEFTTLSSLPEKLEYGRYRCIIEPSGDKDVDFWFRFDNKENIYTFYDIMAARVLKLKVILSPTSPNALLYTKEKLCFGSRVFKPTCDYIYDLKRRDLPRMKALSTNLWGGLTATRTFKATQKRGQDYEIPENVTVSSIIRIGDQTRIEYHENERVFETSFGRIGCFITSYARWYMLKTLLAHRDKVVRIHTDGFVSTGPIPELKVSGKMGDWKVKQYQSVTIKNAHDKPVFL